MKWLEIAKARHYDLPEDMSKGDWVYLYTAIISEIKDRIRYERDLDDDYEFSNNEQFEIEEEAFGVMSDIKEELGY